MAFKPWKPKGTSHKAGSKTRKKGADRTWKQRSASKAKSRGK